MSRLSIWILGAVLLELTAVGLGFPAARWGLLSRDLAGPPVVRQLEEARLFLTIGAPISLAVLWIIAGKALTSNTLRLSPSHKGYVEAAVLSTAFFLIGWQGWSASHLGQAQVDLASREVVLRAGTIFVGLSLAVRGNFLSKTPAPTGPRAPDPASWTVAAMRAGWVMAVAGLTLAVLAMFLPLRTLFVAFALLMLSSTTYRLFQARRLTANS